MTLSFLIRRANVLMTQYGDMEVTLPNGNPVDTLAFEPAAFSNTNMYTFGVNNCNRAVINGKNRSNLYDGGNYGVCGVSNR